MRDSIIANHPASNFQLIFTTPRDPMGTVSVAEVAQILNDTFSANTNTRVAAELKLIECFTYPDVAISLSQLALSEEAGLPLRQISDLIDRHSRAYPYVKERWSPYFPTFKGGAPRVETKNQVRAAVFQGLSDPNRKIRSLCAHTLSVIANSDWPDEYPDLLTQLLTLLSTGSSDSVHGAMQVFTEFIKSDLTEDQTLPILRDLLPVLLNILGSAETHSAPTRARTISVFRQSVSCLFMVKDQHPQAAQDAAASVLPAWLDAFQILLNIDPLSDVNAQNWDGLLIRIQVFKTLHTLQTSFPKAVAPYIPAFATLSLHHLRVLYPTFAHYYISANDSVPRTSEDEGVELPQLLCPILDFLSAAFRSGRAARDWLTEENINEITAAVFQFIQMTDEDVESWTNNANAFVAEEDDETQQYSVRVASFDFLGTLIERHPAVTARAFQLATNRIIQNSEQVHQAGDADWWRPLEAALAAVGSQAEAILNVVDDEKESGREAPIDIDYLLVNIIPKILGSTSFEFLQGRAFVFASQYSQMLPLQSAGLYLDAAVQVLESNETGIPLKISAVKAIHNFSEGGDDTAIVPFAARIAKDLCPFLLLTSEDTLGLALETFSVILEVQKGQWLTPELAGLLADAAVDVWKKNNKDPIFISILSDILENLASSQTSGVYETVVQRTLPSITAALAAAHQDECWITSSGIDLITSLVNGATSGIGAGFFAAVAPTLLSTLLVAEDRDVLQNGIRCLTAIIRKDCAQIFDWKDDSGTTGVGKVLEIVAKVLNNQDESGGLPVGDLIIHLLRQARETVLPVLPDLLRALLSQMMRAKTATFIQSLVIPFAFLINNQRDPVLDLLETINIDGRSGIEILINTWCENAETFQGFWPSRVSTLGLTQLFLSNRPSITNLTVKGDIILKPETKDKIMTRSRTKQTPHEFTAIPFHLKALKIVLHDLQSDGDAATLAFQNPAVLGDIPSDDDDDDWEEDGSVKPKEEFAYLSDLIGPKGVAFDNDDVLDTSDSEAFKDDPISQIDMQAHLVSFLREARAHNTNNFSALVDQMSPEEMLVVQHAVSSGN